jgi:hypothetical protein
LCGWFRRLENWCLVGKTLGSVVEVAVGYLVLFLVELVGCQCGICYLQGCRRVGDGWLSCVDLACICGVVLWLVIWRRISVIVGLVFGTSHVVSV